MTSRAWQGRPPGWPEQTRTSIGPGRKRTLDVLAATAEKCPACTHPVSEHRPACVVTFVEEDRVCRCDPTQDQS